ncbi:MAG: MBL fold metallo-hydrolase [Candidatus Thermoplasmatota archaeon]|nr:MBL fold metallo-hydrolase [Candidatus Thermoplasmatota archaeon]
MIPGIGFSSNVFLVVGEKTLLVDAGLQETSKHVLEEVKKHGELEMIYLTHRHCDHAGGAKALADATGAELLAPEGEAEAVSCADPTTGAAYFGVKMEPVEVKPVSPGSCIDLGGFKLEVLYTPGHTSGSSALYCREMKTLFPGDTVFADGGVGRWDLPTGNLSELKKSVEKLSNLDVEHMYPGHGPAVERGAREHIQLSLRSLGGWTF